MEEEIIRKEIKDYYAVSNALYSFIVDKEKISKTDITERMLRCGKEARFFEITGEDEEELKYIAVSTLKVDVIRKIICP